MQLKETDDHFLEGRLCHSKGEITRAIQHFRVAAHQLVLEQPLKYSEIQYEMYCAFKEAERYRGAHIHLQLARISLQKNKGSEPLLKRVVNEILEAQFFLIEGHDCF